jgi:hypothetical protein
MHVGREIANRNGYHLVRQQRSILIHTDSANPPITSPAPANAAISYKPQKYQTEAASAPLIGLPSAELDAAWDSLLQHSNIRISDQDLSQLGRENEPNVELPDGGYAGLLYVFHDLHCLKRLHQYMFQDYYFPDLDEEQRALNLQHNSECPPFYSYISPRSPRSDSSIHGGKVDRFSNPRQCTASTSSGRVSCATPTRASAATTGSITTGSPP